MKSSHILSNNLYENELNEIVYLGGREREAEKYCPSTQWFPMALRVSHGLGSSRRTFLPWQTRRSTFTFPPSSEQKREKYWHRRASLTLKIKLRNRCCSMQVKAEIFHLSDLLRS